MKKHPTLQVFFALLLLPLFSWAQSGENLKPVTRTYALTKATVITQPGQMIENATIVIKDGLIQAVGKNVSIPLDADVLEMDSMYIYAGFIEGLSHTGIPRAETQQSGRQGGAGRQQTPQVKNPGAPPNDLAGITPERPLRDVLSAKEKSIAEMRKLGFTAAHIVPEGRMLPGQGAIVMLHGDDPGEMILKEGTALFSQLQGARRMYPSTVIAVLAKWRELYKQAELAQAHEMAYKKDPRGMARPTKDPVLQAFYPVINKEQPVFFKAEDVKSAYRVLALQKEFNFPLVMAELKQGWHVVDDLKKANIPVLLSLDLPKSKEDDKKGKKDQKKDEAKEEKKDDPFAKEREALEKRRDAELKKHLSQAASMEKAGVSFAFSTLETKAKDLRANLNKAIENGLAKKTALAALTTVPAKMLGVDDMLGTVEQGKIANLLVTDKPYFEEKSNVRYVFVDGHKYEYEVKKPAKQGDPNAKVDVNGKWAYSFEAMGQTMTGTMELIDNNGDISGTIVNEDMDSTNDIDSATLRGNSLTFSIVIDGGGQSISVEYNLLIDGDNLEGTVSAGQYGTFDVEGERIPNPNK